MLLASRNVSANPRNLDWLLSRAQGAFGVTNYNGDLFLNRSDVTAPLLDKLARTGLGFIFDGSVSAPSLSALARSARLPYASGYNLIDTVQDSQQIQSNLKQLSDTAQLGASPIGVGFAYPETLSLPMNNLYTDQPLDLQSLIKMEKYGLESGLDTMDPFLGKCPKEGLMRMKLQRWLPRVNYMKKQAYLLRWYRQQKLARATTKMVCLAVPW